MAIYLDSAILEEACQARQFGWVHGVTTNPTLMANANVDPEVTLSKLSELGFHQIYYQLVSQSPNEMLTEAYKVNEFVREGLVLKVAPTKAGFRFISDHGRKFSCCVTAVFSPIQALIAREVGARYVALYINRATRQLGDGIVLLRDVAKVLSGSQTEILAASLKSIEETIAAFLGGAQHLTLPFDVLANLDVHPLSTKTLEQFAEQGIGITLKV